MTRKAKVYAVMNRKGGVGKTTSAVTLGVGLARKLMAGDKALGHVLLVDLDPQGNVASSFGIAHRRPNLSDLLLDEASAGDCIVAVPDRPNLFVLPADDSLADARLELATREAANEAARIAAEALANRVRGRSARKTIEVGNSSELDNVLNDRLSMALKAFDFIILDCPPSLDVLTDAVYRFADGAIVPVKPDYLSTTGTGQHTRNIVEAQTRGIDIRTAWVVPTFYRHREVLANEMLKALNRLYGSHVAPPIPQAAAVEQAPASGGLTVIEYAPDSPAAQAYNKLVELVYAG